MTLSEVVSLIRDGVAILQAIILTGVAIWGVSAWKKQLKGKAEYELSSKVLKSARKLYEGLFTFRIPLVYPDEISFLLQQGLRDDGFLLSSYPPQARVALAKYRWEGLTEIYQSVLSDFTEADAVWGSEFLQLSYPFRNCYKNLQSVLVQYSRWFELREKDEQDNFLDFEPLVYSLGNFKDKDDDNQGWIIEEGYRRVEEYLKKRMKL
jgi:hypothetical protein